MLLNGDMVCKVFNVCGQFGWVMRVDKGLTMMLLMEGRDNSFPTGNIIAWFCAKSVVMDIFYMGCEWCWVLQYWVGGVVMSVREGSESDGRGVFVNKRVVLSIV